MVHQVTYFKGDDTLLQYVASAENNSEHPLQPRLLSTLKQNSLL